MRRWLTLRWALAACLAGVLTIGILAPWLSANRFRGQIQSALEAALNRRVTIREVHFNLFRGPGFSVEDVLIDDDPAAGVEPFAHVDLVRARVRFATLLTGHLAFSNLTLVEPSVNLVKTESGGWNFQQLLNRVATEGSHSAIPEIQITSGRLNFKFGDTKSVFYISNADMDVYPNQKGDLVIRFSGEPARTDHLKQGVGLLVARGAIHSVPGGEDQLDMSLQLERTALSELMRLVEARDLGVRGFAASNMKLSGPLSHINVSGDLRVDDIHRWDLMPNKGEGWILKCGGYIDLRKQSIDIVTSVDTAADTISPIKQTAPVTVKFVAADYLTAPRWTASVLLHQLPAASLLETARHLGAPFPEGLVLGGKVDGEVGYSRNEGVLAKLELTEASFKFPKGGGTEFARAPVNIANNEVTFGPAEVRFDNDQTSRLEGRYAFDTQALSLRISTPLLSITETRSLADRLLGTGPLPLLANCRLGSWKGWMGLERHEDGPTVWTGEYDLQNTQIDVPGLAIPIRIASASVELQPTQLQMNRIHARAGAVSLEGDYRKMLDSEQPDRVRITVPELQVAELERIFMPTLRRQEGFLARTFRWQRAPIPEWLKERQVEGSIQIKSLLLDDTTLGSIRTRVVWNRLHLQFPGLETHLDDMDGTGKLTVNLTNALPQYRLSGRLNSVRYRDGKLDVLGVFESEGIGPALFGNATAEGTFSASAISLAADTEVDEMSGEFHLEPGATIPHLALSKLEVTQGANVLHGQGASTADGRIVLDLTTSGRKPVRLTGMLSPVRTVAP